MKPKFIEFKKINDSRGSLVAIEEGKNIPFCIKRVYYIYNVPADTRRGFHAHKTLQQVAICLKGSCKILLDDGYKKADIEISSATQGLFIDKMIWHEMYDFSEDCLLMILANDLYDESDYIRSYDTFRGKINHG